MFDPSETPRVFGLPPGVDFPQALLAGLLDRMGDQPPEALARVEIYVNTRRMQRRLKSLFDEGPGRLLPRIRLVTDLARDTQFGDIPLPVSGLRRRLELTQLIAGLLDQQPDLAPRSALFDLADSLAALMDEMQGEGVPPERLRSHDMSDLSKEMSGHWQRSLSFVNLVEPYFGADSGQDPDAEARQRMVIERICAGWAVTPPQHPIIVAGSTGSRGATSLFMQAVAKLPNGAVVLPGVDFDLPARVWKGLKNALTGEDHPQYRFSRFMSELGGEATDIVNWSPDLPPANPARNKLLSLALRPAPVTDQWLVDGQHLRDIDIATQHMSLIEASSSRAEASAIALLLRKAAEDGQSAALITPDRTLTRQVTAALDRWGIVPDDSAGRPLPLSAPGRFLRHVAGLFGQKISPEVILTLLKHPLTSTGADTRGPHLLNTRELELWLRRRGPAYVTPEALTLWSAKTEPDRQAWVAWISGLIEALPEISERPLADHLDHHIRLAEQLAGGPGAEGSGELWREAAGKEAWRWVQELRQEAAHGGTLSPGDYQSLFQAVLQRGEVRDAVVAHPDIMIWGTLEARVQGADLVILAGLNEGIWPEPPKPDPWLNRKMRNAMGLLLPDRQIGLSAHDFQQAIAAKEVVLSRAIRSDESQTVASRWLNRLTNLLEGLSDDSKASLSEMRKRGAIWTALADQVDAPAEKMPPAKRPSPCPPVDMRPKEISITEVQKLIRDPYAIYARRVLALYPLNPLRQMADAPLRGNVLHAVVERFIMSGPVKHPSDVDRLLSIADDVLDKDVAWPAIRKMWRARLVRVADWFISGEIDRQTHATPFALEQDARLHLPQVDVTLRGKIDRIDRREDGSLVVYDYKTGSPPTKPQQEHFDKQRRLTAMMLEQGALDELGAQEVPEIGYIGLGSSPKFDPIALEIGETAQVLAEFLSLIAAFQDRSRGYTSRRAVDKTGFDGDYDHLARFGEWSESDDPDPQEVGP